MVCQTLCPCPGGGCAVLSVVRRYRRLVYVSPGHRPALPDLRHEPCLAVRSSAGFCRRLFWHPLFWTVPLIALALIFFGARRRWIRRGLIACLFLFAVVWVVRMLLLFPHTPPMTADPGGILPRLTGALF